MSEEIFMPSEIVFRGVDELLPYANNSRTHDEAQIEALAKVIKNAGWTNPCLVADGEILAGHGRIMAAKKLGLKRVPCIDLSHLSEADRRALIISDNQLAIRAGWDLEMLKLETDWLQAQGYDLELTGFDKDSLDELLGEMDGAGGPGGAGGEGEGRGDPEIVPDVPAVPVSRPGDQWIIGDHVVRCGSSLDPADWSRLMGGEQAQCVWTDPPFNVAIGDKNASLDKALGGNRKRSGAIESDKMSDSAFYDFLLSMYRCVLDVMEPGAPIYVAHPEVEAINFRVAFRDAGFKQQGTVIWNKNNFVIGRFDHQPRTETIIYGWKPGAAHKWYGGRKNTNVLDLGEDNPFHKTADGRWAIAIGDRVMVINGDVEIESHPSDMIHEPKPQRSDLHPTMKPVNLINRQLKNSARKGDVVVDAFGGSGSTMLAAHQLGMKARLMELDPKFVDVIARRMWAFAGIRPVHAVTGEPFPAEGETRPAPPAGDSIFGEQTDDDIF